MTTEPRTVKLQVNTSGAWRNVLHFDASIEGDILTLAERLFSHEAHLARNVTLRVIMPGDTAPLMLWDRDAGWHKWRDR